MGHTKGPWETEVGHRWIRIVHPDDTMISGVKLVAKLDDAERDETQDNARLIAAVPDLLEACEATAQSWDDYRLLGGHETEPPYVKLSRAAIAKTTTPAGGQSAGMKP